MGIPDMTTAAWQKEWTDEKVRTRIAEGLKEERDGKKKQMEPFKTKLRPEQVDSLIGRIRSFGH